MEKLTVKDIKDLKGKRKIIQIGAFCYYSARALEKSEVADIIGTGTGNVESILKGNHNDKGGKLEEGILLLEGVRKGAPNTFIMFSMPYGSTFISSEETQRAAVAILKAGADATKIQGGGESINKIEKLNKEGIPCAGHLGLTPWFVTFLGGHRCVGKKSEEAIKIYNDAIKIQEAGASWIELECVPHKVAAEITKRLEIPVIGIGSGPYCDGQAQVETDILGFHDMHYPKHTKKYADFFNKSIDIYKEFGKEVNQDIFPTKENSFEIDDKEFETFKNAIS